MLRRLMLLQVALFGTCISGDALGDSKTMPGNACHSNETHFIYSGSKMCNTDPKDSMVVYCPVLRDVMTSSIDSSYAYVVDQTASSSVTCTLYVVNYTTGSTYKYYTNSTSSSGYGSSAQKLNFGALSTSSYDASYMKCTLPPTYSGAQSCIVSYYWAE